ncbi:MAG TPA: methyltransferase domain-containing protein [Actinopolymorphaceae bacterium]
MNERDLRGTFDRAASVYHSARPDYPPELFDDLVEITGVRPPARLLEVGCGTGKATIPLARAGFRITALELGKALAAEARRNLAAFRDVEVVTTSFEDWQADTRPELIYAATSWHWVDPSVKYDRAADLLVPGGHLAVWSAGHAFPEGFDPFFAEIQRTYVAIGESRPGEWPPSRPDEQPGLEGEFEASGRFEAVGVRRYLWSHTYTAEQYIALLETFSGHIAMAPRKRERLYGEIRRLVARRPHGTIERHWSVVMTVGRRR